MGKDLSNGACFDQLSLKHYAYPVTKVSYYRQVVGNKQEREPMLLLQMLEQINHLRLNRNVQRGDRLICHQQLGSGQ